MRNVPPYNEVMLEIGHNTIAGISWGPKDGKPILAIHGWLDNAASFIPLIPYLQEYRVIAIDLPGHGHSSHTAGSYLHFVDFIADVIKVIDHLRWEECYLLGHSLGAGIATVVAGTMPERIKGLVLLDGIGAMTVPAKDLPAHVRSSVHEYMKMHEKRARVFVDEEEAIQARLKAAHMQRKSVEILIERGLRQLEQGHTWRTDPRLLFTPLALPTEEQLIAFLELVTADTFLIRPKSGFPFDEEQLRHRIGTLKNLNIHTIDGEHHAHMDAPEIVGPLVNKFFSTIK